MAGFGGYGGDQALEGLDPTFQQRLVAFISAAHAAGKPIGLGSGYRSIAEQQRLYNNYINGVPGQARAAKPGRSKHNHGLAMDLDYEGNGAPRAELVRWAHENAGRFGLYFPMDDEDWHIQPAGDFQGQVPQEGGGAGVVGYTPGSQDQYLSSGIMYDLNYSDPTKKQNPQEVLANRLHSVLNIMGINAADNTPGVTVMPQDDPAMNVLNNPDVAPMMIQNDSTGQLQFPEGGPRRLPGQMFGTTLEGSPAQALAGPTGSAAGGGGQWQGDVPPPGYVPPGEGVDRWRDVAIAALKYTGQDPGQVDMLLRRMKQESGGNPTIVNNWDSNAKRGDPTTGLMQNIPSAFPERAKELAPRGITDGFANIVASIRYTLGRYGSLAAGYNRRGGY